LVIEVAEVQNRAIVGEQRRDRRMQEAADLAVRRGDRAEVIGGGRPQDSGERSATR
jgi:hypothetical protein